MNDDTKTKLFDKINIKYYFDNGFIVGLEFTASEDCIGENYVIFKNRLNGYNMEDKIMKTIEKISVDANEKNDEI